MGTSCTGIMAHFSDNSTLDSDAPLCYLALSLSAERCGCQSYHYAFLSLTPSFILTPSGVVGNGNKPRIRSGASLSRAPSRPWSLLSCHTAKRGPSILNLTSTVGSFLPCLFIDSPHARLGLPLLLYCTYLMITGFKHRRHYRPHIFALQ